MFASPLNHQKSGTSPVLYTLGKYVTMRVLATAMFIAFAVLASIGGKETRTNWAITGKNGNGDSTIWHLDKTPSEISEPAGDKSKILLSPSWIVSAVKDAFDEPSLTEYAKEQGAGIPDLPTASFLRSSNQDSSCSKSASTQSSKSSSKSY